MHRRLSSSVALAVVLACGSAAYAQPLSRRGFVQGDMFGFTQDATNDANNLVANVMVREEVFVTAATWLRFAAGIDLRENSYDQVRPSWRFDFSDRGDRRPRVSARRLSVTASRGPFAIDAGKQFIRWGKTDVVSPLDRFAPRDFLTVVNAELLAVSAVRGSVRVGDDTIEAVWSRFTPSRTPLLDQRWAVLGTADTSQFTVAPSRFPEEGQWGVRWSQVLQRIEYSVAFYDGFNHLPDIAFNSPGGTAAPAAIQLTRTFPAIRTYGFDLVVPGRWFTFKTEAAYFTSPHDSSDEYGLYVVQLERQYGEWILIGGYVGEASTRRRAMFTFDPDRGMARAFVARASYTVDANRSLAFEGAIRRSADGGYVKADYSHAFDAHWRGTAALTVVAGDDQDFLGQYHRNSHLLLALRYSY